MKRRRMPTEKHGALILLGLAACITICGCANGTQTQLVAGSATGSSSTTTPTSGTSSSGSGTTPPSGSSGTASPGSGTTPPSGGSGTTSPGSGTTPPSGGSGTTSPGSGTTPPSGSSGTTSPGSGTTPPSGGGSGTAPPIGSTPTAPAKSAKRGIAYDLASPSDLAVLSPGVSWWYNWSASPNSAVPSDYSTQYAMDYFPMLWNGNFDATSIVAFFKANPGIKYMLVLNEPNLVDQANMTPQQAAQLWPQYEAIAAQTGVKIVGPQMTYGTMTNYADPVVWLDAFYAAYQAANNNRDPQIDYLGAHWYDYGLDQELDHLGKYNKPFWVTEFANWHSTNDGDDDQIDTLAKQEAQITSMVALLEGRSDVFRYAWFTGRLSPDPHFTSLLGATGELTDLGKLYLSLPVQQ